MHHLIILHKVCLPCSCISKLTTLFHTYGIRQVANNIWTYMYLYFLFKFIVVTLKDL